MSRGPSGIITQKFRNDYTTSNVTTGGWVELEDELTHDSRHAEIFDSSGALLKLGVGAAGAEVDLCNIIPGGNGVIPLMLSKGQRLAVRSVDTATVNVGQLTINLHR